MRQKKPTEDIVAEYTEDLIADRCPRLAEDVAALGEEERSQLLAMLELVRRLKAAHREPPPPREEFLQRLDGFVRGELTQQVAPESQLCQTPVTPSREARAGAAALPLHHRILEAGRGFLGGFSVPGVGRGWRLVGLAVVMIVLGLQVQLYLHVRRLERQNQALVARLERLSPSGSLVPLGLPGGQQTVPGRDAETPGVKSIDELISGVELRRRLEQRIRELEKEAMTKTGRDREIAEGVLQELRAILGSTQTP